MSEDSTLPAGRAWGAKGCSWELSAGWASSTPPAVTLDALALEALCTPLTLDKVCMLKGEERC